MLQIVIPGVEREEWDEQKDEFVYHTLTKPQVLHLEHSLIALSNGSQNGVDLSFPRRKKLRKRSLIISVL